MMGLRNFVTLILLCLFVGNVCAQKSRGRSKKSKTPQTTITMKETSDIIAGDDQRRDFSKQLCALVKVEVVDDIKDIDGNVMGDIVNRGSEKWVYMAPGSRQMKILLKNNLPVTISFRNYGIRALKSNRVYVLRLDVPNKPVPEEVEVKGNNLLMKVNPVYATVYIWGDKLEKQAYRAQTDGSLKFFLPYGRYHYQVTAEGYHTKENSIFVNDENKWEDVKLDVIMGSLVLSCPTKKVEFFIDGEQKEKDKKAQTWSGELPPGSHMVEARRKGYVSIPQKIIIQGNKTTTIELGALMTEREYKKYMEENKGKFQSVRENSRVVICLKDGSYLTCVWLCLNNGQVTIRQDSNREFIIPVEEISEVR